MDISSLLTVILSGLVVQLPVILASLIGLIVSLVRSKDVPLASRWTLAASLVSLLICLAAPVSQQLTIFYSYRSALPAARIGIFLSVLGFFWGCLHAAAVGLFLVGAYAERGVTASSPEPAPETPPPSLPR